MTLLGADGETESQIRDALQIAETDDNVKYSQGLAYIGTLIKRKEKVPKAACVIANSLWAEKTYPFDKAFLDSLQEYYGTGLAFEADFKNRASNECERINRWVSTYTGSKINNVISPDDVGELTRLVLVNTIYFKGKWLEPFEANDTYDRDFHLNSTDKVEVPIMSGDWLQARYAAFGADGSYFDTPDKILERYDEAPSEFEEKPTEKEIEKAKGPHYPEDDGFQMVELPYEGERLSMVVIAPLLPDGLSRLEKLLTAERFAQWVDKLQERETSVLLPKFTMKTKYQLVETLKSLGMKNAFKEPQISFDPKTEADFSRMTQGGKPELFITTVIHQAMVEVQEKGTEAAAATVVCDAACAAPGGYGLVPFVPVFNADRPFLFFICDRQSHTILFVGRVKRP